MVRQLLWIEGHADAETAYRKYQKGHYPVDIYRNILYQITQNLINGRSNRSYLPGSMADPTKKKPPNTWARSRSTTVSTRRSLGARATRAGRLWSMPFGNPPTSMGDGIRPES